MGLIATDALAFPLSTSVAETTNCGSTAEYAAFLYSPFVLSVPCSIAAGLKSLLGDLDPEASGRSAHDLVAAAALPGESEGAGHDFTHHSYHDATQGLFSFLCGSVSGNRGSQGTSLSERSILICTSLSFAVVHFPPLCPAGVDVSVIHRVLDESATAAGPATTLPIDRRLSPLLENSHESSQATSGRTHAALRSAAQMAPLDATSTSRSLSG